MSGHGSPYSGASPCLARPKILELSEKAGNSSKSRAPKEPWAPPWPPPLKFSPGSLGHWCQRIARDHAQEENPSWGAILAAVTPKIMVLQKFSKIGLSPGMGSMGPRGPPGGPPAENLNFFRPLRACRSAIFRAKSGGTSRTVRRPAPAEGSSDPGRGCARVGATPGPRRRRPGKWRPKNPGKKAENRTLQGSQGALGPAVAPSFEILSRYPRPLVPEDS